MNPEIELVKKWLDDQKSVSQKELERADAYAANAANAARATATAAAAAAAHAVSYAADAATANVAVDAKYWVNRVKYWVEKYEELTK